MLDGSLGPEQRFPAVHVVIVHEHLAQIFERDPARVRRDVTPVSNLRLLLPEEAKGIAPLVQPVLFRMQRPRT